ncbi:MAG: hypothetical protein VB035_05205 [Candidatus Fimivivens sp.]|nr:hypothetical protein [Candidatus Fimivivens sp.]
MIPKAQERAQNGPGDCFAGGTPARGTPMRRETASAPLCDIYCIG